MTNPPTRGTPVLESTAPSMAVGACGNLGPTADRRLIDGCSTAVRRLIDGWSSAAVAGSREPTRPAHVVHDHRSGHGMGQKQPKFTVATRDSRRRLIRGWGAHGALGRTTACRAPICPDQASDPPLTGNPVASGPL